jgi:DNA-binding SARP family transcriptional activator
VPRVSIHGPLVVERDGEPVVVGGPRERALPAILALAPVRV